MLFINTRPSIRAEPITQALQAHHVKVLELPLLVMTQLVISANDKELLGSLSDFSATMHKVLVVVSPTAAEFGCKFLQNHNLMLNPSIQVVAVGQSTANSLAQYGISAVIPKFANNESMLALDCLKQLTAKNSARVMVWRGQGGRRLLIDDLRERGISVDVVEWYCRHMPENTPAIFYHWINRSITDLAYDVASNVSTEQSINNQAYYNKPSTFFLSHKSLSMSYLSELHGSDTVNHPINGKFIYNKELTMVLISSADAFKNWQKLIESNQDKSRKTSLADFHYLVLGTRLANILIEKKLTHTIVSDLNVHTILDNICTA